jgi:HPt (histidine-containing phosphotransfer) domain-containing protein
MSAGTQPLAAPPLSAFSARYRSCVLEDLPKLLDALERGDATTLGSIAHRHAGLAATFGASGVAAAATAVHALVQTGKAVPARTAADLATALAVELGRNPLI